MKISMTLTAAAIAGLAASAAPARSAECELVVKYMSEALEVAAKNYAQSIEQIKGAADQTKAKSHFCAITGEFLGASTAFRAIVNECVSEGERRETIASLDKSIGDIQSAVDSTCK